jgi:hypothetical protein
MLLHTAGRLFSRDVIKAVSTAVGPVISGSKWAGHHSVFITISALVSCCTAVCKVDASCLLYIYHCHSAQCIARDGIQQVSSAVRALYVTRRTACSL